MERFQNRPSTPDWNAYIEKSEGLPPRKELVAALAHVSKRDAAADLGAGALNDAQYLLREGFAHVVAVDSSPITYQRAQALGNAALEVRLGSMQDVYLETNTYNLISAQNSLYFVPSQDLPILMNAIHNALTDDGIFSAQFLGPEDSWSTVPGRYAQSEQEVLDLLSVFEIIALEEHHEDAGTLTAPDSVKHWHLFNVLAKKHGT